MSDTAPAPIGHAEIAVKRPRSPSPAEAASKKPHLSASEATPAPESSVKAESADAPATGSEAGPSQTAVKIEGEGDKQGQWAAKKGRKDYQGRHRRNLASARDVDGELAKRQRTANGNGEAQGEGSGRLPKKRVALLVGYCGTGYSGMQIQPAGEKTIEGEIFQALVKAGAVSADNADDHRKVDVQRAARTDAGVHAAGNCISLKMIIAPPLPEEYTDLPSYVNSFLPEQIRVWGFVRAMKSFQARTSCDSRIYEYLLPSYCLLPPDSECNLSKQMNTTSPGWREKLGPAAEFADAALENGAGASAEGEDDDTPGKRMEYERRRGWRVDEATLERFRQIMAAYKGTHNFHNFTVGRPFTDRAAKRHMIRLEVKPPQVYGEIEWISVHIHGQSFMLHQIRKMISLAILATRTATPARLVYEAYGPKRIHIPKAPPLGLLLEAPQFKTYNDRIKSQGGDFEHDFVDYSPHAEKIMAFKIKYIYEKLRLEELEKHIYHKWIRQMDCITSKILRFLNADGTIPPEATVSTRPPKQQNLAPSTGAGAEGGEVAATATAEDGAESSDEDEVDQEQLKRGELEG